MYQRSQSVRVEIDLRDRFLITFLFINLSNFTTGLFEPETGYSSLLDIVKELFFSIYYHYTDLYGRNLDVFLNKLKTDVKNDQLY